VRRDASRKCLWHRDNSRFIAPGCVRLKSPAIPKTHYTENWVYVGFAAAGSWIGAFATISFMHRPAGGPPVGAAPE
jgi:hypothetical protein